MSFPLRPEFSLLTAFPWPVVGVNVNGAIVLNCASSSDDHAVASCAWTVDGQTTNDSTLTLAPTPFEPTRLN